MAEAAAVVGLIASIASLVDLSVKIVSRLEEFVKETDDVPKSFQSLADRLPLLSRTLRSVQDHAESGQVHDDVAKDLDKLVKSILNQVRILEQCLDGITPSFKASRFERAVSGLKSLAREDKVERAVKKVHNGIDVLVLHQTTNNAHNNDSILRELANLNLAKPSVQTVCGLYLEKAPQIDPDAFIGRERELEQLYQWLLPTSKTQNIVSIVGMGGLGKTQLSLAFARGYGDQYSSVFWLNAKDELTLRQSMAAVSQIIFRDTEDFVTATNDEFAQAERVRRWLSESWNDRWLVVLDNYDDPDMPNIRSRTGFDIRSFFPVKTQGNILITTRSPKLMFSKRLTLQRLDDVNLCVAILSQRCARDLTEDFDAKQLALQFDGLPLALATAGTYLGQMNISCTEYLHLYKSAWMDLHGSQSQELLEYEDRKLSTTWIVSFDKIRSQDEDAAELLKLLAYFSNQDIWYDLIYAGAGSGPPWMTRVTSTKLRFDRAMAKLRDYSLVEIIQESYQIHPCLQDWILAHFHTTPSAESFLIALNCIRENICDESSPQYWISGRRLLQHIKRLRDDRFKTFWTTYALTEAVLVAGSAFGRLYLDWDQPSMAETMYLESLAGSEKSLGLEHTMTLDTVNSLGKLYRDEGRLAEAELMCTRALVGREKTLGREHPATLDTINTVGLLYWKQGKLKEAESMYMRALAGREKILGSEHTSTLHTVNNLGILYADQDKLKEAKEMCLRALTGFEKALGKDHESTLMVIRNLGGFYYRQDELNEAEKMWTRAQTGYEKALGTEHSLTLDTVHLLGMVACGQGKLVQAEEMYQRALTGYEKALGAEHISNLDTVYELGRLYYSQGKLEQAEEMYQRALIGHEKAKGAEHTLTLDIVHKLGNLKYNQGRLDEAYEFWIRASTGYEKVLGAEHTSTLGIVCNLGVLYTDQGKLDKAEQMYQKALVGYEKVQGAEHMSTLNTANKLGSLKYNQGKLDEAYEQWSRVSRGYEKALGAEHTLTLDAVNNLGILYHDQGKLDKAKTMWKQALVGYEKALGVGHTSTLGAVHNLSILYHDQGKMDKAQEMNQRALVGYEKALGEEHRLTLLTIYGRGILYHDQGKLDRAKKMYLRALTGFQKVLGQDHTRTTITAIKLGTLLVIDGREDEAMQTFLQSLSACQSNLNDSKSPSRELVRGYAEAVSKIARLTANPAPVAQNYASWLIQHFCQWGLRDIVVAQWVAKALLGLKDDENARMALAYSINHRRGETLDFGGTTCDGCHRRVNADTGLHVCQQCIDVNFCNMCMSSYPVDTLSSRKCVGHGHLDVGAVVLQALQTPKAWETTEMETWIVQLKQRYQVKC